jgi:erythronate-4-phosphate dehydrogenase
LKIVADENIPFLKGALEPFSDVVYLPGNKISREDLIDADALLVRTRTRCNEALLKGTSVKFIGTATIGFDHIDSVWCDSNSIKWTNAPGCNSSSVQQYIATVLLKLAIDRGFELKDKTLCIIGVGNVGSKVERIARIFGMNVLLNDPPRERIEGKGKFVTFDTILRESDIITLHVPLNNEGLDKTRHMFSGGVFDKVAKRPLLINSSRGEVVDTSSLKSALKNDRISGVILDVWENEPDIDRELLSSAYISTPHIAGYSTDGKANGTSMVVNALSAFFNLPLRNWFPGNVPLPHDREITVEGNGKSADKIIGEAVKFTYDVEVDDRNLRLSPETFEKQRGGYRLRREFTSFSVIAGNCDRSIIEKLAQLGFKVETLKE